MVRRDEYEPYTKHGRRAKKKEKKGRELKVE